MAITLKSLWTFVAVADAGGITAGAQRIGRAQSTVSATIRALQADIGASLFETTALGVHPTDLGAQLRRHAVSLALDVEQALADLHAGRVAQSPPAVAVVVGPANGSVAEWALLNGVLEEAWRSGSRTAHLNLASEGGEGAASPDLRLRYDLVDGPDPARPASAGIDDTWRLLTPGPAAEDAPVAWQSLATMRVSVGAVSDNVAERLLRHAPWLRFVDLPRHGVHHALRDRRIDALLVPSTALGAGLAISGLKSRRIVDAPFTPLLCMDADRGDKRVSPLVAAVERRLRLAARGEAPQPWLRALQSRIDLQCLRCFAATVETGATTRAAAALTLAQPALSVQIRKLENAVKRALFERSSGGMQVTAAGARLYEMTSTQLTEHDDAMSKLREQATANGARDIRLGLIPPASEGSLVARAAAEMIGRWRMAHPLDRLSVVEGFSTDLVRWLRNQQIDLAILDSIDHEPGLDIELIQSEPMMLVMAPGSPWACDTGPFPARRLGQIDLVMPSRRFGLRRIAERALAAERLVLKPAVEVDGFAVALRLVRHAGFGAIFPASAVGEEIANGSLCARTIVEPRIERRLCLAVPTGGRMHETTRKLGEAIAAAFVEARQSAGTLG